MRKLLVLILIILLILGGGAGFMFVGSAKAAKTAHVIIEEGSGGVAIAKELKEKGVIRSEKGFLLRLMTSPYRGKLQYGEYDIKEGMSITEIFDLMVSGKGANVTINITIPEGYSAEQIGALCEEKELFTKEEFLSAVSTKEGYDFDWLTQIEENKDKKYILQGYLYPDTYNVFKDASPQEVVTVMLQGFESHFQAVDMSKTDKTMDEIVNEAAIIEKETAVESERATVAGVIENRLQKGMRLEVCPSALYPITDGMYDKTTVSYKDTKVESPYNTYRNKGLPVGPICN
ncbi:MAG: endolytic transglycosylase MltG, partial [Lachnospiraceae bacterium]|nr:endolytic transglycosylase MltG [Lachnospiraceae bacterium]